MDIYNKILSLSKRRGIFSPSYEIYGGAGGFYDYGPLGSLLKNNVERKWRELYIIHEKCFEISTPSVMPYEILKASGHVDEFLDVIVTCEKCKTSFKIKEVAGEELEYEEAKKMTLRCPECGEMLKVGKVNLMFETFIGPLKKENAFLRPETAQGIFVNFPSLYQFFRKKLPFGVVQIGKAFRNEISPRQGIIRLREFSMAEAEIFFEPDKKGHLRFAEVKDDVLTIIPSDEKERKMSIEKMVEEGIVGNEAMAYYMAITKRFLISIGIDEEKLRFRQHLPKEMAHYANECWDAEVLTTFGWIECVGIADRSAYDLQAHMNATGADMTVSSGEKEVRKKIIPKMDKIGPAFKEKAGIIQKKLEEMEPKNKVVIRIEDEEIEISPEFYEIKEEVVQKSFIPHVIEPSYGIDRIIYCILEHNYRETEKEGEKYVLLSLSPSIAPIKAGVFPLVSKDGLPEIAREIEEELRKEGILVFYDEKGSIGRRYARMDEIGTPFCITIDYTTLKDNTVTIRNRDTTEQIRMDRKKIAKWIKERI